jgi:hypothetical protein
MPGQRPPGSWGLEPRAELIDQGTSCLISTPSPLPVGFDANTRPNSQSAIGLAPGTAFESVEKLQKAVSDFHRSETWSSLQPIAFRLLGQYSFGLGVVYGIGENVVTSVVELLLLVKMLLLADLYDRAQQPVFSAASLNPVGLLQRMLAEVSMRTFSAQLTEAHRERVELIEELRYAMTHIGEVLGNIKEGYVAKWNRFETLVQERTFSSQFHAGRIFGEVLIEVVTIIGGGTAAVRAASKIPKLAKLARLKIPAKSTAYSGRPGGGAVVRDAPSTPSQVRPAAPAAEPAPKPPSKAATATEAAAAANTLSRNDAAAWFRANKPHLTEAQIGSQLKGIDFTKPVVMRELRPGDEILMYVREGGQPGSWATTPGTPSSVLGLDPSVPRNPVTFVVKERVMVLESVAADAPPGLAHGVGGPGGGLQLTFPQSIGAVATPK